MKVAPKKPRSRRRKATRPRKRISRTPKSTVLDSSKETDEGAESEGDVDVVDGANLDPLHMAAYATDDEEGEGKPMEVNSEIPGAKLAAALDTVQQQVRIGTGDSFM